MTLRITGSAVMLAVLLSRLRIASLLPEWHASSLAWLAGGLVVTGIAFVLSTLRWQRVLDALGLPARLGTLLSHFLAGQFVGNFLPSTIGGDILRVTRLSASNGESPGSFASVVLERLTGWIVLPFITLFALLTHPELLRLADPRGSNLALALSIGTLVLLGVVLFLAGNPRLGGRLAHQDSWLRFVGAIHLGLDRFRRRPGAAVSVLLVSCAYQLAIVVAAWMGAQALGIHVGWAAILAFVPAVAIAQVVPISVGGLGVREGAFVLFLHPLGVATSQAIALGLLLYGMHLAVSLLGAPAFAVGARPARVAA